METLKRLQTIVERKYKELQEYTSAYNEMASGIKSNMIDSSKEKFKKHPESIDIDEIGKSFLILGFHQADIKKLQEDLISVYKVYNELGDESVFDSELVTAVNILKNSISKQFFIFNPVKLTFEELEAGRVEQAKKDYRDKNYFRLFESQIQKLLSDE